MKYVGEYNYRIFLRRYDIASNSWKFEADLPNLTTGFKLINVDGRPAIVGRW